MCSQCDAIHDMQAETKSATKSKSTIATHEELVARVHAMALQRPTLTREDKVLLKNIKLTYGSGPDGVRGVTYYKLWSKSTTVAKGDKAPQFMPFVAVCATGQSDHIQLIGTTLHELGHVIAGMGAAHGPLWHAACERLGLVQMQAAGTAYTADNFKSEPVELDGLTRDWRKALMSLPRPKDGQPVNSFQGMGSPFAGLVGGPQGPAIKLRPCTFGRGSRGGVARGQGSGSRQVKYTCGCTIVRASRGADLQATCNKCGNKFVMDEESLPPSDPTKKAAKPATQPATGSKAGKGAKPQGKAKGGLLPPVTAGIYPQGYKPKGPKAGKLKAAQAASVQAAQAGGKRASAPKGPAGAARSRAFNAPLPTTPIDQIDPLAVILGRIDPK